MPISKIVSVTAVSSLQGVTQISSSDYTVQHVDDNYRNSALEVMKLTLDDPSINKIQIEYATYPQIINIQEYFDTSINKQNFGSFLVKHPTPVRMSIAFNYIGNGEVEDIKTAVIDYMDKLVTTVFSMDKLIDYLRLNNYIVSINDSGISIEYTYLNDKFKPVTKKLTSDNGFSLEIKPIEFFYIDSVNPQKA